MRDDREFVAAFRSAAAGDDRLGLPTGLVEAWEATVADVAEGYEFGLDEYFNDISVRDSVERVLTDDRLRDFPQMGWVRERVRAADERFRALLHDQELPAAAGEPWWQVRVPRRAAAELAAEVQSVYGLSLDVVER